MGDSETELNPDYLRQMLITLREFDVEHFECAAFKVHFPSVYEEEEEAGESTALVGFNANNSQDDDEDEEEGDMRAALHARALGLRGRRLPTLGPLPADKDEA